MADDDTKRVYTGTLSVMARGPEARRVAESFKPIDPAVTITRHEIYEEPDRYGITWFYHVALNPPTGC